MTTHFVSTKTPPRRAASLQEMRTSAPLQRPSKSASSSGSSAKHHVPLFFIIIFPAIFHAPGAAGTVLTDGSLESYWIVNVPFVKTTQENSLPVGGQQTVGRLQPPPDCIGLPRPFHDAGNKLDLRGICARGMLFLCTHSTSILKNTDSALSSQLVIVFVGAVAGTLLWTALHAPELKFVLCKTA